MTAQDLIQQSTRQCILENPIEWNFCKAYVDEKNFFILMHSGLPPGKLYDIIKEHCDELSKKGLIYNPLKPLHWD